MENSDVVSETKLLGTLLIDILSWFRNAEDLVKKGYARTNLLNTAAGFYKWQQLFEEHIPHIYKKCFRAICCCLAQQSDKNKHKGPGEGTEGCCKGNHGEKLYYITKWIKSIGNWYFRKKKRE